MNNRPCIDENNHIFLIWRENEEYLELLCREMICREIFIVKIILSIIYTERKFLFELFNYTFSNFISLHIISPLNRLMTYLVCGEI